MFAKQQIFEFKRGGHHEEKKKQSREKFKI